MVASVWIGSVELVTLGIGSSERSLDQVAEIFPNVPKDELREQIAAVTGGDGSAMPWSFNAALIRLGPHQVLVDTGFGYSDGGPGMGMADLLAEAGTEADRVDTVVITHAHGDHMGGLMDGEKAAFGRARLCISRREIQAYEGESGLATGLAGYQDRTVTVEDRDLIAEGPGGSEVRALAAYGHTPGHIGLEIQSGGEKFRLLVDTAHTLFQLRKPEWSPRYDADPLTATRTRKTLFGQAADEAIAVLVYHFPFPGTGTVRRDGAGFRFEPL